MAAQARTAICPGTRLVRCRPGLNGFGGSARGGLVGVDARIKQPSTQHDGHSQHQQAPGGPPQRPSQGRDLWNRPLAVLRLFPTSG